MSTPYRLIVPRRVREEMVLQALTELPNECCGMLAGRLEAEPTGPVGRVLRRFPLINAKASPVEFESEPKSMLAAEKAHRQEGLEFLAIYHSHPTVPPVPSKVDLARNYDEGIVNLIISLRTEMPEIRGWWLGPDGFKEAEVEWVE